MVPTEQKTSAAEGAAILKTAVAATVKMGA
jgi:hypothetical protein